MSKIEERLNEQVKVNREVDIHDFMEYEIKNLRDQMRELQHAFLLNGVQLDEYTKVGSQLTKATKALEEASKAMWPNGVED